MTAKMTAQDLAKIMNCAKSTMVRRANREKWPFTTEKVRGGYNKKYLVDLLPEQIRIEVAKHQVTKGTTLETSANPGGQAGSKYAQDTATMKEKERTARMEELAAFNHLPQRQRDIALARADVLMARDAFLASSRISNKKQGTAEFCSLYNSNEIPLPDDTREHVAKVSVRTLTRWQRDYNNNGLAGLVNAYKNPKKGTTCLPPAQQDFVVAMIKGRPHSAIATIHLALDARFPDNAPTLSSLKRFVGTWKKKNASLLLYLTNPDAWRNKFQFAVGDASEQVDRVNQVWEFDSTPADVMLVDGRHSIIGVIDVYTKRFKLLVSRSSKATAVAALLRAAIMDWGVPEIAKTDNGADYVSKHIVLALAALEIEQHLCPPFTPESKPHIERAFKTFSHSFAELLPGYIGHSVADRKDIEARKSFAARLGNKDGLVDVKMTAEELQQFCDRWTEAVYHQKAHGGLDGRTPADVARAWRGTERRIDNPRALDILLAEAPQGNGTRTVTKNGISVNRINYISDGLAGLEGQVVRVKLDPADLGTVYVYDEDGGFLTIAVDPLRKGVDRAEIASKLRAKQKAILKEGSKQLRKIAREQATEQIHEEILARHEAKNANVVPLPKKSETYTTRALEEAARTADAIDREEREDRAADDVLLDASLLDDLDGDTPEPEKKASKVVVMVNDGDRYNHIKTRERSGGLTQVEHDFLTEFYKTRSGRMYMELEGDLREKLGLKSAEAGQG